MPASGSTLKKKKNFKTGIRAVSFGNAKSGKKLHFW